MKRKLREQHETYRNVRSSVGQLRLACSVAKVTPVLAVLLLITYIPGLTTRLPRLFGY